MCKIVFLQRCKIKDTNSNTFYLKLNIDENKSVSSFVQVAHFLILTGITQNYRDI